MSYDITVLATSPTRFLFRPWTNKGTDWLVRMLEGHQERVTAGGAYLIEGRPLATELVAVAMSDQIKVGI